MYFEGCLGFNFIQQNGLMSRVFVGSFLLLRITSRPTAFIRLDLWVLIREWIIGYLPPLPSHPCSMVCRSCVCVCVQLRSWENTRQAPTEWAHNTHENELQSATKQAPFLILSNYEMVQHSARVSLPPFSPLRSCRAATVLHRPSDEARQLEQAEAWHVNSR